MALAQAVGLDFAHVPCGIEVYGSRHPIRSTCVHTVMLFMFCLDGSLSRDQDYQASGAALGLAL